MISDLYGSLGVYRFHADTLILWLTANISQYVNTGIKHKNGQILINQAYLAVSRAIFILMCQVNAEPLEGPFKINN